MGIYILTALALVAFGFVGGAIWAAPAETIDIDLADEQRADALHQGFVDGMAEGHHLTLHNLYDRRRIGERAERYLQERIVAGDLPANHA